MDKAKKVEKAVLDWLNGEVDHIQLVRTEDGHEHVHRWRRDKDERSHADKRS